MQARIAGRAAAGRRKQDRCDLTVRSLIQAGAAEGFAPQLAPRDIKHVIGKEKLQTGAPRLPSSNNQGRLKDKSSAAQSLLAECAQSMTGVLARLSHRTR
jgi:hypothetical protein